VQTGQIRNNYSIITGQRVGFNCRTTKFDFRGHKKPKSAKKGFFNKICSRGAISIKDFCSKLVLNTAVVLNIVAAPFENRQERGKRHQQTTYVEEIRSGFRLEFFPLGEAFILIS
jgi:hypothetical protein